VGSFWSTHATAEKSEGSRPFQRHMITCDEDREKKFCLRSYSNIIVGEYESGYEEGFCYIHLTLYSVITCLPIQHHARCSWFEQLLKYSCLQQDFSNFSQTLYTITSEGNVIHFSITGLMFI